MEPELAPVHGNPGRRCQCGAGIRARASRRRAVAGAAIRVEARSSTAPGAGSADRCCVSDASRGVVDKTLTIQKLTDIIQIVGSGTRFGFPVVAELFAGTLLGALGAAQPIEKAQNGNGRPVPRVGMDWGWRRFRLGWAPQRRDLGAAMGEEERGRYALLRCSISFGRPTRSRRRGSLGSLETAPQSVEKIDSAPEWQAARADASCSGFTPLAIAGGARAPARSPRRWRR